MDNTLEEVEFDGSGANLNLDDEQISFGYLIRTVEDNQAANAARLFARKEPLRIENAAEVRRGAPHCPPYPAAFGFNRHP